MIQLKKSYQKTFYFFYRKVIVGEVRVKAGTAALTGELLANILLSVLLFNVALTSFTMAVSPSVP